MELTDQSLYINRQISWLEFNLRVLHEALDRQNPLLERVKFLAIFSSNLDEFFMLRISGLRRQLDAGVLETSIDGLTPPQQMSEIRHCILEQLHLMESCWRDDLLPQLKQAGIQLLSNYELSPEQQQRMREYFLHEIYPVLTPLAFDPSHPFPHISNLSLNLAVVIFDHENNERFARLKVPDSLPRLLALPASANGDEGIRSLAGRSNTTFIWLEEVISANLDLLFPGLTVQAAYPFRVTRDADLEIEDDEAADLLVSVEESVGLRDFASEIRLEVAENMPVRIRELLANNLNLPPYLVYTMQQPLGMADLMELMSISRADLKDAPFIPIVPSMLINSDSVFSAIRERDILLYHPYHSFNPVVDFIRTAAADKHVLAIKQTLYRVGHNSPVVDALLEARDEGKQVAVLVELKARFDEENNIAWARALEHAGVHVVYGIIGLKTHAKITLVVRRENDALVRYVHLGTGNYNPVTARLYTDFGLLTCDSAIGEDASTLFNSLTGYSFNNHYQRLIVAPESMRQQVIALIDREIARHQQHGDGYLAFKMNQLVDPESIRALYRASMAGVKIALQIRGICCLRPGIDKISENISVTSIVGRFLEHARIYYFRNGGADELYLGSADLMERNLDRRVETLFPINDPHLRHIIVDEILSRHLDDNAQCWELDKVGEYHRRLTQNGETALDSQAWMMEHAGQLE